MAPITPHWAQPSHPDVQDVIINAHEFTSKSLSKISLPPFGIFAKMSFPPCTSAPTPTYATVQCGRDQHLNLNSDLLYINHSCEPSLIFDTATQNIVAGPNGLRPGQELTFFYPSTEWHMAQPFDCICGTPSCRGRISGAKDMTRAQLEGVWLNGHIHQLLKEQELGHKETEPENGSSTKADVPPTAASEDATAQALRNALGHAEKVVEAARIALQSYLESAAWAARSAGENGAAKSQAVVVGEGNANGFGEVHATLAVGLTRRGVTSRELSGEMGGDTIVATGS
ncbi:hypothetical protein F4781DRAFT_398841 [Annulohypoxylon bovei var. microspora]|nr:hypothetical protein F4781DRAFT_398841 [Annulohypoxylon bovei var. microspora]